MALSKIESQALDVGQIGGRRNVLINGNFDVWQRATSYTDVAGIWKYGHADRWAGHNDGADAGTWSRSTTVPNSGSTYSMLMTGATSVTNTNFIQKVESQALNGIRAADSMTISGWVRSATAGKTININALCPTATDNFAGYTTHGNFTPTITISGNGTTGSGQITLTSADTWYYFTATKTGVTSLTNFDKGFAIYFSILSQTSSSEQVYMSQIQIEAGSVATPFEHRSYGEELALCQRYYEIIGGSGSGDIVVGGDATGANEFVYHSFPFVVQKRATPTVTIIGNWNSSRLITHAVGEKSHWGFRSYAESNSAGAFYVQNSAAGTYYQAESEL